MKILLLGATGLLGAEFYRLLRERGEEVTGVSRSGPDARLDLCDKEKIERCVREACPDAIVNAAAITSLAACEEKPFAAYDLHARLVGNLVEFCRVSGAYLLQVSTDHYYTGDGYQQHTEDAPVRLLNEYARTKYLGECLAQTYENSLVVRTNFVGMGDGKRLNFLRWVVESLRQRRPMTLFSDFYTSSMAVSQLATFLVDLLRLRPCGILNVASSEVKSKEEFILGVAERIGIGDFPHEVGSVHDLPGTRRADSLGLAVTQAENLLGQKMPGFAAVLDALFCG